MNLGRVVVRLTCAGTACLSLASWTTAATGELARCAEIDAPDARLACYDKLAGRTVVGPPASVAGSVPPSEAAPATSPESAPKNFGLTLAQQHKAPEGPPSIQARITNLTDRGGTPYVHLENGQLWTVTDGGAEPWLNLGDLVTIKRGALGSFLLFTKSKRSYHAHRVQ